MPRLRGGMSVAALAVIFLPLFGDQSGASFADPCSFAGNIETKVSTEAYSRLISGIVERVQGFFGKAYLKDIPERDRHAHFTHRRGYFFVLDCEQPNRNRRLARAGMFGVGHIFLPKKFRYFTTRGKPTKYLYGLTEYGLYAFIRADGLTPMKDDTAYLFNAVIDPVSFCTNDTHCGGPAKEINARHHFATMPRAAFEKSDGKLKQVGGCVALPVKVHEMRDTARSPTLAYGRATLQFCDDKNWNGIEAWTRSKATAYLEALKVKGQYFFLLSNALAQKLPFVLSRIRCEQNRTIKKKKVATLGGSVNAGSKFKILEAKAGGGIEISYEVDDSETFDGKTQYLYPTYTILPQEGSGLPAGVNDLVIEHECKGKAPERTRQIFLHVDPASNHAIAPDLDSLVEKAKDFVPTKWRPSTSGRLRGYTWRIFELRQYYQWRKLLWETISDDLSGVLPEDADADFRDNAASFYLAVLMAASFEYVSENEIPKATPWTRRRGGP